MSRVFFDVSALPEVGKAVTGISRVLLCVLRQFVLRHPEYEVLGISFRDKAGGFRVWQLEDIVRQVDPLLGDSSVGIRDSQAQPPRKGDCILLLGEQWLFPACLLEVRDLKVNHGVRVVSLIHDLVPFFMPELYWDGFPDSYISCLRDLVDLSDGLVVNSANTAKDLLKYIPQSSAKREAIDQVRLGDRFDFPLSASPLSPMLPTHSLESGKYILCVGTIQPRKNHLLLLTAWRRLSEIYGDSCPTLILVGMPGWNVGDLMYFLTRSPVLKEKVRILEQVSDDELQWLYSNCWFSIYPSLYEGWGLPIAESIAMCKLCLSSNSSAMPEVAGDLADYFSPHDSGELIRLVSNYIENPSLVKQREELIKNHYKATSWSDTADQFAQTISKVLAR